MAPPAASQFVPTPYRIEEPTATATATAIPGPSGRSYAAVIPSGLFRGPSPTPSPTPTTPPARVYAGTLHPWPWANDPACLAHPDRFNWQPYARAAGFPEEALEELAYVIAHESGGDLCQVNRSSGATCWVQQLPGGPGILEPATCMAYGYAKWVDGGRAFWKHWYRWW